ncbi:MAG: hypothetical protein ACE5JP_12750 [Candidatus Bipolaricaulia bacterium]
MSRLSIATRGGTIIAVFTILGLVSLALYAVPFGGYAGEVKIEHLYFDNFSDLPSVFQYMWDRVQNEGWKWYVYFHRELTGYTAGRENYEFDRTVHYAIAYAFFSPQPYGATVIYVLDVTGRVLLALLGENYNPSDPTEYDLTYWDHERKQLLTTHVGNYDYQNTPLTFHSHAMPA